MDEEIRNLKIESRNDYKIEAMEGIQEESSQVKKFSVKRVRKKKMSERSWNVPEIDQQSK